MRLTTPLMTLSDQQPLHSVVSEAFSSGPPNLQLPGRPWRAQEAQEIFGDVGDLLAMYEARKREVGIAALLIRRPAALPMPRPVCSNGTAALLAELRCPCCVFSFFWSCAPISARRRRSACSTSSSCPQPAPGAPLLPLAGSATVVYRPAGSQHASDKPYATLAPGGGRGG